MNDHNTTHDAWQNPTQPRQTTRWAVALERRISEVSLTDFCHFCLMFLLVVATAKAVFQNGDAQTQPTASQLTSSQSTLTIAQIRSEAEMRIAEGASAEEVMAWMDQAMVSAGLLEDVPTLATVKARQVAIASPSPSSGSSRSN